MDRIAAGLQGPGRAVERLGSGDLTLGRRKFSGSAQRRLRTHFLVHATILYDFPLELIERYTHLPRRQPSYRANRPHGEFLVNLDMSRADLVAAIQSAWLPADHPRQPGPPPHELVGMLVRTKFADPAWIERL
jgi:lipoate-protein ligase A